MPRTLRAPIDEQDALWERSAWRLNAAILRFARAMVAGRSTEAATLQIGRLITQTLVLADLLGRRRVILMQDDVMSRRVADRVTPELFRIDDDARLVFTSDPTPMVAPVTFDEMIQNILERQPRLAVGYQAVQDLYSREFAFAVAKSVTEETTKRVQKALAEGFRTGQGAKVEQVVAEIGDWSNSYSECVYRTNMATAYTAGQFQQAKDPDLAPAFPALEYIGISDSVTRPNHRAAFGLIAATADPIWNEIAPPLGYNDRCGVTIRNKWALMDAGLYRDGIVIRHTPPGFAGAHADHGFTHSAVGTVYR